MHLSSHRTERRPSWPQLSQRFTCERECLASYLALETAEVLAGEKPGNLINMVKRPRSCGRDMFRFWRFHGHRLLQSVGLEVRKMVEREESVLLFIYHPKTLRELLSRPNVLAFLRKTGYAVPDDPARALDELQSRFADKTIPHEVGVFLGYPLKDVAGFMGMVSLPFSGQGPWKFYGDPERSIQLADSYNRCRCRMASRLETCHSPLDCLCPEETSPAEVVHF